MTLRSLLNLQLSELPRDVLLTVVVALGLTLLVHLGTRLVSRKDSLEAQRFWRLTFRNMAVAIFLISMGVIWKEQLQSVIVALGAAVAGVIVAFREAFLSLLAFWLRVVKRHYGLGDFIEIDGIRGEVVDITYQHTALAETGPGRDSLYYTGRIVQIPNNRMLLAPMSVDNFTGSFGAHVIQVPLPQGADIIRAEDLLRDVAEEICTPYYAEAQAHLQTQRKTQAIDTPTVDAKVRVRLESKGLATLVLRIVVPAREKLRVEQAILRQFLTAADRYIWPTGNTKDE